MGLFSFKGKKSVIASPGKGEVLNITECSDKVFSSKMMGDGFLFIPEEDDFYSPVNGKVSMVFETKHAIAFEANDGTEVLMHVGMDTVNLKGEGYNVLVKAGDKVKIGQKVLEANRALIKERGYKVDTPVIITNLNDKEISLSKTGKCEKEDEIIIL